MRWINVYHKSIELLIRFCFSLFHYCVVQGYGKGMALSVFLDFRGWVKLGSVRVELRILRWGTFMKITALIYIPSLCLFLSLFVSCNLLSGSIFPFVANFFSFEIFRCFVVIHKVENYLKIFIFTQRFCWKRISSFVRYDAYTRKHVCPMTLMKDGIYICMNGIFIIFFFSSSFCHIYLLLNRNKNKRLARKA